jgi:hypothetical protein
VPANSNDDTGRLARPYAITGGRTDAPKFLHLESQLRRTARSDEGAATHRWEAARIIEMTGRPVALVEVAARVGLPVGVTKIVVADLIEQGALTTGALPQKTSFSSLLERVLDGLDSV